MQKDRKDRENREDMQESTTILGDKKYMKPQSLAHTGDGRIHSISILPIEIAFCSPLIVWAQ